MIKIGPRVRPQKGHKIGSQATCGKTFIGLEQIVPLCGSRTWGAESIVAVAMYK
jgi:hypothetical protein